MQGSPVGTLVISILATCCCCPPLGFVAMVFSTLALGAHVDKDYVTAQERLDIARRLNLIAVFLGLFFLVVYLLALPFRW